MPRVFVYIVVISVLTCAAHRAHVQQKEPRINGSFETEAYEELCIHKEYNITVQKQNHYLDNICSKILCGWNPFITIIIALIVKKSLKHQRKDHADAVKRLEKIDNYERLYKMMMILGENMVNIIESSRTVIESAGYHPERRFLPQNLTIQSAISGILENTLLFGDVVLHFPHVMHRILKKQEKWNTIINWSLNFTNRTKHLLGEDSLDVINLMAQELRITEREPGYINPYWKSAETRERNREKTETKRSLKKEKRKRGPRMTKIEL